MKKNKKINLLKNSSILRKKYTLEFKQIKIKIIKEFFQMRQK